VQAWAPRGFEVARVQALIPTKGRRLGPGRHPRSEVSRAVGPRRGGPDSLDAAIEAACAVDNAQPTLWRAPTDNDGLKLAPMQELKPLGRWRAAGLDHIQVHTRLVDSRRRGPSGQGGITVVEREITGTDPDLVITQRERWRRLADGALVVAEDIVIPEGIDDVARVGWRFTLPVALEHVTWYGRGPIESYPDRARGAHLGRFTAAVLDQYVPYVMPQEHGGHAETRWGVVHEVGGRGLLVTGSVPFQWNVSRFTPEQLTAATHAEELVPVEEVVMHVDARHRGLGTMSCGPDTLPEYRIGPGRYRFTWALRPVHLRRDDVAAIARALRAECLRLR